MIESGLLHIGNFFLGLEFFGLIIFLVIATIYDIKSRRIPNWLIISGLISSFFYQFFSGYGYGFTFWFLGLGTGFLLFFPLYVTRAMGAGDVKMIAVVGSLLGATGVLQAVTLTLLAGGFLAILVTLWKRSWKLVFQNISLMTTKMTIAAMTRQFPKAEAPLKSAGNLPYGVAIAAGTLLYIVFFRP